MIFVSVDHPEKENLRIVLVAGDDIPPVLKHFFLERRESRLKPWEQSRKLKADKLDKFVNKFEFDMLELKFELEEKAEKMALEREE